MFDVVCYNNTAENMRVDKSSYLTAVATYSGELIAPTNTLAPAIELDIDTNTLPSMNYCYIAAFGRYYYINSIVATINGLWQINCIVDVLMSHKTLIKGQTAYIARNENTYNEYLIDNVYPTVPMPSVSRQNATSLGDATFNPYINGSVATGSWIIVLDGKLESGSTYKKSNFGSYLLANSLDNIADFLGRIATNFSLGNIGQYIHDIYYVPMLPSNVTDLGTSYTFNFPGIDTIIQGVGSQIPLSDPGWKLINASKVSNRWSIPVSGMSPAYQQSSKYRELVLVFPPFSPVNINPDLFMCGDEETDTIYIECSLDVLTGAASLYYGEYANNINIPLAHTNMRIDVPIGTSSISIKNIVTGGGGGGAGFLKGMGQVHSGLGTMKDAWNTYLENFPSTLGKADAEAQGMARSGAASIAGGAAVAAIGASVAAVTVIDSITTPTVGLQGSPSGTFIENPRLIIIEKNIVDENLSLYGRPLCETRTLSQLTGYTKVAAVHLEGMTGVMGEEIQAIEQILLSGVIL